MLEGRACAMLCAMEALRAVAAGRALSERVRDARGTIISELEKHSYLIRSIVEKLINAVVCVCVCVFLCMCVYVSARVRVFMCARVYVYMR